MKFKFTTDEAVTLFKFLPGVKARNTNGQLELGLYYTDGWELDWPHRNLTIENCFSRDEAIVLLIKRGMVSLGYRRTQNIIKNSC